MYSADPEWQIFHIKDTQCFILYIIYILCFKDERDRKKQKKEVHRQEIIVSLVKYVAAQDTKAIT